MEEKEEAERTKKPADTDHSIEQGPKTGSTWVGAALRLLTAKARTNRRQQSRVQSVLWKGSECTVTVKGHNTGKRKR